MRWQEHRRGLTRAGIYLIALVVVVLLLQHRSALIPAHRLTVTEVREAEEFGSILPGQGEKLVAVGVELVADAEILSGLKPAFFALLDAQEGRYHPDPLSPLFLEEIPGEKNGVVKGVLVFRLNREIEAKSLSFDPEVVDHAPNHQPEDPGPESGP